MINIRVLSKVGSKIGLIYPHFSCFRRRFEIISTTNVIENLHRQFRKDTKLEEVFSNDQSLLKMLYLTSEKTWIM